MKNKEKSKDTSPISFVKEVAKYFMNFLETDFKKRRIPKRNTIQKMQKGLKVGIDLEKYPKLKKAFIRLLNDGFKTEVLKIKKGEYTTSLPKPLFDLIKHKIKDLSQETLNEVFVKAHGTVEEKALLYADEYDKFLEEAKEETKNIFARDFILPFLNTLDKPLDNLELADENSKYQLELDIIESIFSLFEEKYTEILQSLFGDKKNYDFQKAIKEIISIAEIQNNLVDFFTNLTVGDAFNDIYQLYRNTRMIDKTEIYFYCYELVLGNEKFPILYTPITIIKEEDRFIFQFDKRIYVNTKALDFVVQEFNVQAQKKSTLAGEFERIIYVGEESDFYPTLEKIIRKIENFFEVNRNIDLKSSSFQKGVSLLLSLTNKCYLYLFDKSDEALINDYEEILNDDGELLGNFSSLLQDFVEKNPTPFMEQVEGEWDEKNVAQKLIFESPVPLNDEQKQVLLALKKPDCKFMILEGPPGTGKSHTITAVICKALLEEKSVLVLSDKKEALDVVENKISETLNKVRKEDDFQNPILRLGRAGNKFYQIVQGQTIQQIKEHYRAYKSRKSEYENLCSDTWEELKGNIQDGVSHYENINIEDVKYYFKKHSEFSAINWLGDQSASDLKEDFFKIKEAIQKIREKKDGHFNGSFVTETNLGLIEELQQEFEELEEAKKTLSDQKLKEKEEKHYKTVSAEDREEIASTLEEIRSIYENLNSDLSKINSTFSLKEISEETSFDEVLEKQRLLDEIAETYEEARQFFKNNLHHTNTMSSFILPEETSVHEGIQLFNSYLSDLKQIRNPVLGYLFKKEALIELSRKYKKTFHFFSLSRPQKNREALLAIYDLYEFIHSKLSDNPNKEYIFRGVVECFLINNDKAQRETYKEIKNNYLLILQKIEKLQGCDDLKICEIKRHCLFIEILNLIENIQSISSEIKNIKLKIDCSFNSLKTKPSGEKQDYLQKLEDSLKSMLKVESDIQYLLKFDEENKKISERISLNISSADLNNLSCCLMDHSNEYILKYFEYREIEEKLESQFNDQPDDKFFDLINNIQDLVTAQMTYFLDERIIKYTENNANEASTLKNIIRKKQKFPQGLFQNLKKAFPCILAGIRDYAEFIPLEKNLFDLVIIDEASQVSVAQALPALIRGKQIIILGDDKQFSNVKAGNASKVTNQQYKQKIQSVFSEERIPGEDNFGWLEKVKTNFDIKNSVLKFMRFIRNYECQLKKHFRCYPEIISYSDKHFYDNTLQCMKIRAKHINDVIKIDVIPHDGKADPTKNTNELEVDFIIGKMKEFKKKGIEQSLGIISPHREQVTLFFDKLSEVPEKDWLFEKCKLKIMTFDTCQGEERDYIFYSMVASREKDRLNWIFLKSFSSIADETDGTIKSQRMNVGFSRAKECLHLVLSKPIEEFQGEIRNALFHYKNELEIGGKRIVRPLESPMEYKIDEIFHNTKFYKENKDKLEFIPQFPIGDYLKQLDKNYSHPGYKVDFLLLVDNKKIVIEYDGFKEHFVDLDEVNASNFQYYMKADDLYRQKILEGYGYEFIRINRFNIGDEPEEELNDRIESLVKKKPKIPRS